MTKKAFAWLGMTLFALGAAAYVSVMLCVPALRPIPIRALFAELRITTYSHFIGGVIALATGALQFNMLLRTRFIGVHRWLGRLYCMAVVVAGAGGLLLVQQSPGGATAHLGFGLLALLWMGSTLMAYCEIRRGNVSAHRAWMMRSYALTFASVTFRLYLPLSQMAGFPMVVAYPVISWIGWVLNLLIAEWFIRSGQLGTGFVIRKIHV
ncbi:DUF2306 domain-containing protein [Chitinimonas naiadis]